MASVQQSDGAVFVLVCVCRLLCTGVRYAMRLKEDPFNPDNQFIRGEFYEAVVRIALKKYPRLPCPEAIDKLCREVGAEFFHQLVQTSKQSISSSAHASISSRRALPLIGQTL